MATELERVTLLRSFFRFQYRIRKLGFCSLDAGGSPGSSCFDACRRHERLDSRRHESAAFAGGFQVRIQRADASPSSEFGYSHSIRENHD